MTVRRSLIRSRAWARGEIDEGVRLSAAESRDEADARFSRVAQSLGGATDDALQALLAEAVYNRGVVRHHRDGPAAALEHLEAAARVFPGADGPRLREQRARALHAQAMLLLVELEREDEALSVLGELIDRFSGDRREEVRWRVASALYGTARAMGRRGERRRSCALRARLLREYSEQRELVDTVRTEMLEILPPLAPARHADHGVVATLQAQKWREDAEECRRRGRVDDAEEIERRIVGMRELDRRSDAMTAERHAAAEAILTAYRMLAAPFALYLRNFEFEAQTRFGDGMFIQQGRPEPPRFEFRLAEALRDHIPVIGIANPALRQSEQRHPIPKLAVDAASWSKILERLLYATDLVVMQLAELSGGVTLELDLIRSCGCADVTTIVITPPPDDSAAAIVAAVKRHLDIGDPVHAVPDVDDAALAGFAHVVREDKLDFRELAAGLPRRRRWRRR